MTRSVPLLLVFAALAVGLHLRSTEGLNTLGPEIDRSSQHYWAGAVLAAPEWGVRTALEDPRSLMERPETRIYQLAGPVWVLPHRVFNLSSMLLISAWTAIFGGSPSAALALGLLQAVVVASACAWLAVGAGVTRRAPSGLRAMTGAVVFASVMIHPFYLVQSSWSSWHTTALGFMVLAGAVAQRAGTGRAAHWPATTQALVGLLLVAALYASYLLPLLFVAAWGGSAMLDAFRRKRRGETLRELLFWTLVALAVLPAVAWLLLRPQEASGWVSFWARLDPVLAMQMVARAVLASSGLLALGAVAILAAPPPIGATLRSLLEEVRSGTPWMMFSTTALILVVVVFNAGDLDRLLIYLIPLQALAAIAILRLATSRPRAARVLAVTATLCVALQLVASLQPVAWLKWISPAAHARQDIARLGTEVSRQLRDAEARGAFSLDPGRLAFRNRDLAGLVLARFGSTSAALTNVERLIDAQQSGDVDSFLRTRVVGGQIPWPLILIGDPEAETLVPALESFYDVQRLPFEGSGRAAGWFAVQFRPKDNRETKSVTTPKP